jgi:hypothetical protein
LIKEILDERLKDLKIMLDQQLISYQDYYNGVIQASIQALDSQIAAQRVLLSSTTDLGAREKIKAQIIAFELEKGQIIEDQDNKRLDSEKKLDEQITALHVQLLKDQGRLSEARALEIGDKFKDLVRQLKAEGRPGDVSVVERLLGIETAKTRLDELTKHATEVQQTLSTRLSAINAEQEAGALNERQAREQIVQAYKNAHKELTSLLPEMRELAKLTEDPTAIDNVEQLSIKFEQMGTTIRRISDDFFRLKTTLKEASTDAIAGIFTGAADVAFQSRSGVDALTEHLTSARKELDRLFTLPATSEVQSRMTQLRNEIESVNQELENSKDSLKSWSDLFVDAARSIVQALQRVISEMLATLIVQQAISFLGFASGGAVNATLSGGDLSKRLPVATGGHIRGAGSGTSDSIPAWLSNGEFVVRERAVRAVGVDLLQEINSQGGASPRGRRRTRGYADGGLVASVSAAEGSLNAVLGLEEGLVVRHMESNAGTRAVLKVIGNNRKSVNAVLGR